MPFVPPLVQDMLACPQVIVPAMFPNDTDVMPMVCVPPVKEPVLVTSPKDTPFIVMLGPNEKDPEIVEAVREFIVIETEPAVKVLDITPIVEEVSIVIVVVPAENGPAMLPNAQV